MLLLRQLGVAGLTFQLAAAVDYGVAAPLVVGEVRSWLGQDGSAGERRPGVLAVLRLWPAAMHACMHPFRCIPLQTQLLGTVLLGTVHGRSCTGCCCFRSCCIVPCDEPSMYVHLSTAYFIYLVTGLLDNIRHCCPVDGPSQTP